MTESEMSKVPVKIIGAGISGLVLGQCLRRKNIPSVIFERIKENPTRNNYGITLYNNTYRPLLETLGISENDFKQKVAVLNPKDNTVVADEDRLRVNRAALTRLLQDGLHIRWEHKLKSVNSTEDSKRSASFQVSDGNQDHTEDYRTLIASDGVHSAARSSLGLPESAFSFDVLPYIVFNGKRRIHSSQLPEGLLDCFKDPDGISHTQDRAVLSIKADFWDAEKEIVAVSYTFSRSAGESDKSLLERNISDAETLAKIFVDQVTALGPLPEPFGQVFNSETMGEDRLLHWLMRSSLLDLGIAKQLASSSGVVMIGDAAHAQPIPGYGANTAINDAFVLAKHIGSTGGFQENDLNSLESLHETWTDAKRKAEQDLEELPPMGGSRPML